MAVRELEKGAYEPCRHLCAAGCGIYADRPGACRTFECQWLRGVLEVDEAVDHDLRPDACGVIFDYQPATAFGEAYVAWEVAPGAAARGHARDTIEGLRGSFLVIIMTCGPDGETGLGDRSFVGPPHRVMQASELMRSKSVDRNAGK